MEEKKIKEIDFRRSELYMEALHVYYANMNETLDTINIVPSRNYKRIHKDIFKEFKYTLKQVRRNYNTVYRYERNLVLKAKLKALRDKIKSKFKKK